MIDRYVEWKGWNASRFGQFGREDALYYAQELNESGIPTVDGLRIGEFGFGNGAFAGWVCQQGGHWVGREGIPELHERATQAGFDVIAGPDDFSTACGLATLDLIVAIDVIEHLEVDAIRAFLLDAERALRPGGLLVSRLPSGDSPFSGAVYRGDVTHRTLLGSSAVRQLAGEAGLEVRQIRSPVLPIAELGAVRSVRRTVVFLVQSLVFPFIRSILIGNRKAVVSPNMLVVLRKAAARQ
jgi:SAM-dependent methyltransferase